MALAEYKNSTLVGNWYEDRFGQDIPDPRARVMCSDLPHGQAQYSTTSLAATTATLSAPSAHKPQPPSLYNRANLPTKLDQYGTPDRLAYSLGPTAPQEHMLVPDRHMTTTNQIMFDQMPAMASTSNPEYFGTGIVTDRKHFIQGTLSKPGGFDGCGSLHAAPTGAKGARGEISRRPLESGNPYGVSVFTDEYAKWQTTLSGKPSPPPLTMRF